MATASIADEELYAGGAETVLGSWEAIARGSRDPAVVRGPGVAAAVFATEPERSVYNNALLARDLAGAERAEALDAMAAAYVSAGVTRFAAWTHDGDTAMRTDLEARGYTIDTVTRAMGMALADLCVARPDLVLAPSEWARTCATSRPPGCRPGCSRASTRPPFTCWSPDATARPSRPRSPSTAATTAASTTSRRSSTSRRRGLGTALTPLLAHDALGRGCRTASLQSTAVAERAYAAVGFRDLGRILEYVPPAAH